MRLEMREIGHQVRWADVFEGKIIDILANGRGGAE